MVVVFYVLYVIKQHNNQQMFINNFLKELYLSAVHLKVALFCVGDYWVL